MKKILIINGHPNPESYNFALAAAYKKGAISKGAQIRQIDITHLDIDVFSLKTFTKYSIPIDLKKAQKSISWADHMVLVHPIWWADMPAIVKMFIEQTFLMGFAAKYESNGKITKLLTNKSMRIITTMDTPVWIYKYLLGNPSLKVHKANFGFCGIKPVKQTCFGPVIKSTTEQREIWLKQIEEMGKRLE